MKNQMTIDIKVSEKDLVENCLNLKYSGYDWRLFFFLYALGERMHINKFNYYWNMLEK